MNFGPSSMGDYELSTEFFHSSDRRRICLAVSFSMMIMVPPQHGHGQVVTGVWVVVGVGERGRTAQRYGHSACALETDEPETAASGPGRAGQVADGSRQPVRELRGHTPASYSENSFDAGAPPASCCVNGSQGHLLVTHKISLSSADCRNLTHAQRPP